MRKLKQAAALKYEPGKDSAPRVVASGRGYIAEKIIDLAKNNDVPLYENEWASEILCSLPVDSQIPEVLYQTIAEIYAFILHVEDQKKNT